MRLRRAAVTVALLLYGVLLSPKPARGEEFHLKDGTRIVGKIVAYEEDAFRVETSFGFAIVYKDRIERIIFVEPELPPKKRTVKESATPPSSTPPKEPKPVRKEMSVEEPPTPAPKETVAEAPETTASEARPAAPPAPPAPKEAVAEKAETVSSTPSRRKPETPPPPPVPETIVEHVTATEYVNETYRFQMFKPPTWRSYPQLVKPQTPLVAALGTPDETTLLLIGRESYHGTLDQYAQVAENSLRRLYQDYQRQEEGPINVAGLPAIERRFTGAAEGRFWTGVAVYFAQGRQHFTLLGLTAAGETTNFQLAVLRKVVATLEFLPR
jgi:hypothetical protein